MFTTRICTVILCDQCKKPIGDDSGDYDGHPHFDSEAEALAALSWDPDDEDRLSDSSHRGYLAGLQLTADTLPGWAAGLVLCFDCLIPLICAARGHRWAEWRRCRCATSGGEPCRPRIPAHAGGCPEIRYCNRTRCFKHEERAAAEVTV